MKTWRNLILLGGCFCASNAIADTIRLRADDWCPYSCEGGKGPQGYMVDIAQTVFEGAGHKVQYEVVAWSRAVDEGRKGVIEGIVGAITSDAEGFVFPTAEMAVSMNCFYVKSDNAWKWTNIDSLKNVTLGAVQDYSYEEAIDAHIKADGGKKVKLLTGDETTRRNLEKLIAGRLDVMLEEPGVAVYNISKLKMTDKVKAAGCTDKRDRLFIAFSPSNPKSKEYAKILSDGIEKLRKDGKLQPILDKYGVKDWK